MNWRELLTSEIEATYPVADNLMAMVEGEDLKWKPATGDNWLTLGQLLRHISDACGGAFHGFITGDWGLPEGVEPADMPMEDMLPPAEKFPTVESVEEARQLLAKDRDLAVASLAKASDERLGSEPAPAPWDPSETPLGCRLLHMVEHLNNHKAQLFSYLKLMGKPVNTGHLYGMGSM